MTHDEIEISDKQAWLRDVLTSVEPLPTPPTLIPRLRAAVRDPQRVRQRPTTSWIRSQAAPYLDDIETITPLTYTLFADVDRKTDRLIYKLPQLEKRTKMSVAALQVLLGDDAYVNLLHDYMWSTC